MEWNKKKNTVTSCIHETRVTTGSLVAQKWAPNLVRVWQSKTRRTGRRYPKDRNTPMP